MKRITMNKSICRAFCLCVLSIAGVTGVIVETPLNAATSVGGQSVFNCSSDLNGKLTWAYTTDCGTGGDALTNDSCDILSGYTSHYTTEKPNGFVCNLVVLDAVLSLGGCYQCNDGTTTSGRVYNAFLVVIDSEANFTTNTTDLIPGEYIKISNSISYGGPSILPPTLPPSFYWTSQSDHNRNITSYQESTTNSASSYIVVEAQKPDVTPFACNLLFNAPNVVPPACANNTPSYRNSWITPTYKVQYPTENLTIPEVPNPCLHQVVELTCSASGHPIPSYKWFNLTNGAVLSDVNTVTIDLGGSYQCVASNTIRNVLYNASTSIYVSDCDPPHNVNITASSGPCPGSDDSCDKLNSDTLTCKASGFPEPEYEWSYSGKKEAGATVVARKNIGYQCTATNHYADQYHSASSTIYVNWLTVLMCVELGISDAACISLLVIVIYFGLNLLFFTIFMTCYGCSKSGRNKLNEKFDWLEDMLPCMNDKGCKCSVWIVYFVLLSIFAAFIFFPTILIMASCCGKKKKGLGNTQPSGRNGRGAGSTPLNTLGATPTYQHPARMSVTPNPPSSLNSSDHFQQDPTNRPYPHSNNQHRQPEYWGNSGPYPQNPRNVRLPPPPSPSPLSTGGIIYAELGVDNQPQSRRPIQPIQDGSNTYADLASA